MFSEELAALTGALNLLAKQVADHDKWARDYNVTVEARNQKVSEAMAAWKLQQEDSIQAMAQIFEQFIAKLDAIGKKQDDLAPILRASIRKVKRERKRRK